MLATLLLLAAAPKVGEAAPRLTFKDTRYLRRSLDDFKDAKAFVLVFTSTSCPLVPRYFPTLNRLEKDYRDRVFFVGLNVGEGDNILAVAAQALRHEVEFPVGKDEGAACARALGVTRTPEVVVLDRDKRLRYRGRIDDQYRPGGTRPAPTRHDLKEALDAVLAGRDVEVKETTVDGCPITVAEDTAPKTPVTFNKDVAPILHKHCAECHRPGTAAPFSLLTYEQAAARARAVAEVVRDGKMPPWYGSPEHGQFVNRRGLSAAERDALSNWVKAGKPRGEGEAPAPPKPAEDGWVIGKPALVVQAPEHELPAEGIIAYKYVLLTHVFLKDVWVQGVQILPDNPRVLHHCNMAYVALGGGFKIENFITGYVPGGEAMTLRDNVGFRIPAGSMLVLQVHYVTTGKPEKCRIAVGLKYATERIDRQLRFKYVVNTRFAIPPGAVAHPVGASRTLECDALGVGLFAHMHTRGKDMTFRAHYPDGKSETLLTIPNYSFDWQHAYRWEFGKKKLPKGTRLECLAHYDNSTFNPFNPDPKATVREGQQTFQEMMNGFVFYVDADEKLALDIDPKTGRPRPKK